MGDVPDFERAAYGTASAASGVCQACGGPLPGEYFQVDGRVLCPSCRAKVGTGDAGGLSARERVIMAIVYGGGAAILGSIVWYVVAKVTGMELGIIGIGVGFLVGHAVKKGSRGRGGRGYQALAIVLTYLSIVSSYVPMVIRGIAESAERQAAETTSAGHDRASGEVAPADGAKQTPTAPTTNQHGLLVNVVLAAGAVLWIAIEAPFLAGASNFMGLLIIGIALWEAWKITRRVEPKILGPYRLAP